MPRKSVGRSKTSYKPRRKPRRNNRRRPARSSNSGGGILKTIGTMAPMVGGAIGNFIAPGIGGAFGTAAGNILASIAGHGAYTVKRNTVIFPDQVPIFNTNQDGCIRMVHREFITDITTSTTAGAFRVQQYPIDVASPTTFPYLAQIAANFEEWHLEGLIFEYKTTSGSISSTGQLGTAIMATQYNSNAAPFTTKQAMEAYTFASSTVVSASVIHPVECDPAQTPSNGLFYTNVPGTSSTTGTHQDLRWQQLGNFSIATQGCAANENVGELWVSYDVILCKPRLIAGTSSLADHLKNTTGISNVVYFGTNPALTINSDGFTSVGASTIYFNSSVNGRFSITYGLVGNAGLWVAPTFAPGVGATSVNMLFNNTSSQFNVATSAASVSCITTYYVDIVSTPSTTIPVGFGASVTLSGGTFFTPGSMDLIITQIPSDFI